MYYTFVAIMLIFVITIYRFFFSPKTSFEYLIVFSSGLSLCIEKTSPVSGFEAILQVSVDENLDGGALGSDREGRDLLRRSKVSKDQWAEDRGKGHQSPTTSPDSRLNALLCKGHTMVDPSPSLPFSREFPGGGTSLQ